MRNEASPEPTPRLDRATLGYRFLVVLALALTVLMLFLPPGAQA